MSETYYRLHGGRLTLPECWGLARSWGQFLTLLACEPFGGFPFRFSIPRPEALQLIDPAELPADFRARLLDPVTLFEQAGLGLAFVYRQEVLEPSRLGAGAALLDPTGTVIGTVASSQAGRVAEAEPSLTTHFTDGTAGITTTARKRFRPQPHHLITRCGPVPPAVLVDRHREHLGRWEAGGKVPRSFTRQQLPVLILEAQQRFVDFHVARGLFVPMTDEEVERQRGGRRDDP